MGERAGTDEENVNSHLNCPITKEMFSDPVLLTGDGHTYERSAVEKWLSEHNTSPLTGAVLSETKLIPNFAVRGQVDELASATTEHSYRPSYVGVPVATLVVAGEKGKSKVVPKGKEHAEKQAGVSESQPSGSTLSSPDRGAVLPETKLIPNSAVRGQVDELASATTGP